MTRRVLATGIRGKTGVALADLLADPDSGWSDVELRGGSSDPGSVSLPGVRPTAFSWDDPGGWPAALDGVDAVYVVRPDRADAPELVEALLDEVAPGVRVVLLSEQDADVTGPDGWAPRVERVVRGSGRPWTVLRPSWFMQVFTDERFWADVVAGGGELAFPAGGARVAWIDARDIAAVAAHALLEDGHAGATYELTGPEALTLPETAAVLAAASGQPVVHRESSLEEAVADLAGFDRELTVLTFERVAGGSFATVTDAVVRVTGRPARPLSALL